MSFQDKVKRILDERRETTLHKSKLFTLKKGPNYYVFTGPAGKEVFMQDQGAVEFEQELEKAEKKFKNKDYDYILSWLWDVLEFDSIGG